MIVTVEGLKGSGKSSLVTRLSNEIVLQFDRVKFVQFPKRDWTDWECECAGLQVELFTMLYDPGLIYIMDRCWTVTNVVYNRISKIPVREHILNPPWLGDLYILYCRTGGDYPYNETIYEEQIGFGMRFSELGRPLYYLPWEPLNMRAGRALEQIQQWRRELPR